ncbi:MAG TPA: ABC-2 family transporter protein [Polyangiaceae bacterium]|nr:ABC-2 family transporter protein [Polyangiaceae bacterium]
MRTVTAYPTLLRIGFASAVAYRTEMLVWMLTMTMPFVSLALWSAVAADMPVGRFDQKAFTAYFLATIVVRQLSGSWVVWELIQEIKSGALSSRLLKPIHPLVVYSADNLAAIPLRALFAAPLALFGIASGGAAVPHQPHLVAAFLLSLFGAWIITFFVMVIVGSLTFFMESSTSIFDIWLAFFMLLSGYLVPLELFPSWVRSVADVLPFRYTLGFPVEILIGMSSDADIVRGLAIQYAYGGGAAALALLLWRTGVRRFGAFGG